MNLSGQMRRKDDARRSTFRITCIETLLQKVRSEAGGRENLLLLQPQGICETIELYLALLVLSEHVENLHGSTSQSR